MGNEDGGLPAMPTGALIPPHSRSGWFLSEGKDLSSEKSFWIKTQPSTWAHVASWVSPGMRRRAEAQGTPEGLRRREAQRPVA